MNLLSTRAGTLLRSFLKFGYARESGIDFARRRNPARGKMLLMEVLEERRLFSGPVLSTITEFLPHNTTFTFNSAEFIAGYPATFVSLQYGQVTKAITRLRGGNPQKLLYDESVDQLRDMERFAAQVAAVDAVISITNTGAHLAGALGKRMVVYMGDGYWGAYPARGADTFWYPQAILLRKEKRPWAEVLQEAGQKLGAVL